MKCLQKGESVASRVYVYGRTMNDKARSQQNWNPHVKIITTDGSVKECKTMKLPQGMRKIKEIKITSILQI